MSTSPPPATLRAAALAEELLRAARAEQTAAEHGQAQKLARMMEDRHGKELTIALVDQAFRSRRPGRIADQLRDLLERYGVPRYMEWWGARRPGAGRGDGPLPAEPPGAPAGAATRQGLLVFPV